jgi:diacylglycerol kinase (ATP)
MELIKWSYTKRQNIKAIFDYCPSSTVIFRPIRDFYFIYIVNWSESDPVITKDKLATMEQLLNKELGTENEYLNRKSNS